MLVLLLERVVTRSNSAFDCEVTFSRGQSGVECIGARSAHLVIVEVTTKREITFSCKKVFRTM